MNIKANTRQDKMKKKKKNKDGNKQTACMHGTDITY